MKKIITLTSIILGTSLFLSTETIASTAVDSGINLKEDMAKLDKSRADTKKWMLDKLHEFAKQGWALEKNIEKLKAQSLTGDAATARDEKVKALEAENAKITEVRQALGEGLKAF